MVNYGYKNSVVHRFKWCTTAAMTKGIHVCDSHCVGPLPRTLVDFWRLIWQERTPVIVMLTNLKEGKKIKCQKYWPDSGSENFGPFTVTITDQQVLADYTIRTLKVTVRIKPLNLTLYEIILTTFIYY